MTFILLAVLVIVMMIVAVGAQTKTDRWNRAYQQLARRFGGTYIPGGWFRRPSVEFRYGGTRVKVDTSAGNTKGLACTRIQIDWPDHALWCEVLPQRLVDGNSNFWRAKDVDVGSHEFSGRYAIRSNDINLLRSLLTGAVQWQIDKLRAVLGTDEVYVAVGRGLLTVKKLAVIKRFDQLEEFVYLALELYDLAMLTQAKGIEFVEDGTACPPTQAICQVCGEDIVYEMVFCRRCRTPHHLDCWQYYGACSTYGCHETRYVTPKMAGPSGG